MEVYDLMLDYLQGRCAGREPAKDDNRGEEDEGRGGRRGMKR